MKNLSHAEPVNARLLEALRTNHQWHIDHDDYDGYPGSELEATNLGAIAADEAQQAGPVRLTDGWISVADAMPCTQQQVDIAYIDHHGKHQTTMGWHCPARTIEASDCDEDADSEYDKETDTYYLKEQWVDESHESEYHYQITGVTHWKPRAKHPDFKPQAKGD